MFIWKNAKRAVVIALLFCAMVISGCNISKSDVTTIRVSFWGEDAKGLENMKNVIAPLVKKRKDIKIVFERIPWNQYMTKLQTEFAGGVGPDVVFCEVNNFVDLYSKDVLIPLDPFIAGDTNFNSGEYYPEIIKRFVREGRTYVIPRDIAPFACVFYNKSLFDQAGIPYPKDDWTTDDLLRIGQKLTIKKDNVTEQYGYHGWALANWLYTFGGGWVDDSANPTKLTLSFHKSRMALQFYHDLMWKYGISPTPGVDQTGAQLFMTGRLAMYNSGIWESAFFEDIQSFDWDVVMFPKGPDGNRGFASGGSGYAISKSCKNPQKAWAVVKCLADVEGQIKMAMAGQTQPSIKRLVMGPAFSGNGRKPLNKNMLDEATKYVDFDPFHPKWSGFNSTVISMNLDRYFRNEVALDETLRKIDEEYAKQRIFDK